MWEGKDKNNCSYLIELDDVGMPHNLEDMDLSCDPLDIALILDFIFFEDFNSNLFPCEDVGTKSHLAEGSLPKRPTFSSGGN